MAISAKALNQLRSESESRSTRITRLEVVPNQLGTRYDLPGSMVVFVGRKDRPSLGVVRKAISGDAASFKKMGDLARSQYALGKVLKPDEMVAAAVSSGVFADIRYAGTTLNSGVFLPDGIDFVPVVLPYNGGVLAKEGFSLVEHVKDGSSEALDAFVVSTPPKLTAAEVAAVKKVEASQRGKNVGSAAWCETTAWAVVSAVGDAVTLTLGLACLMPIPEGHLSDVELASLGPNASARKILQLRRDALVKRNPRQ